MSNPSTFKVEDAESGFHWQYKHIWVSVPLSVSTISPWSLKENQREKKMSLKVLKSRRRTTQKILHLLQPSKHKLYSGFAARICLTTASCHLTYVTNSRCDCSCRFLQQCLKYRRYSTAVLLQPHESRHLSDHIFLKLRLPLGLDSAVCLLLVCRN